MNKEEGSWLRFRIFVILGCFFILFGVVLARAFQIQVIDGSVLSKKASGQVTKTIKILAKRGTIYDRNFDELAVSIVADSIYANPRKISNRRKTAKALAPIVGMPRRSIEKRLASNKGFVWIKRQVDISKEQRKTISELEGIGTLKKSRRSYPNNQLAANIIGFEGIDSKGLEGIELKYDKYLKGAARKVRAERDARRQVLLYEDPEKTASTRGMDLQLTIDKVIQNIAEQALNKSVKVANARGGMAIVMDPNTGEILAMANAPSFDLNRFHMYGPKNWRNRSVTDTFEPGSVTKAFLLAAVLEEGVMGVNDIINCENGSYKVADRTFHDTKKHGWLSLANIVKYSSNIGSAKVGEKLGKKALYRYYKRFGFAQKTGIDLPGEGRGSLRHYKNWSGVTLQTISFGQGISTTGIQLVSAMAAIANGGYIMQPHVVKSITNPQGEKVFEAKPIVVQRVLSEATTELVTKVLVSVTKKKGTGTRAAIDGFDVAGKTGTAQKIDPKTRSYSKDAYMASFLGFVPANDPKFVILVAIDEPEKKGHYGGTHAAPVFAEIARQGLAYLEIFPEGEESDAPRTLEARFNPDDLKIEKVASVKKGIVPNLKGKSIRRVLRVANELGAEVSINGSGVAIRQRPVAGRHFFASSDPLEVWFK